MISNQKKRVFGLDLIRAIAIFLVVLSHASILAFPDFENFFSTAVKTMGAVGVDLFFILSGFLIGGLLLKQIENNKTSISDLIVFWKRRWLRTLPNYYFVLFLNVLFLLLLNKNLPKDILLFVPFLQNFSTSSPDFFTESWSLSIEEYAYLLVPFVLFLSYKIFQKTNKSFLFFWVTLLLIIGLFLLKFNYYYLNEPVTPNYDWSASFRKVVIYRMDAIYLGFLLVYFVKRSPVFFQKYKEILFGIGLSAFVLLHITIYLFELVPETNLGFYVFAYLQVVIISLGLLFPFIITLNYSGILVKPVQFISVHSYSIYLVNYSIVLLGLQEFFDINTFSIYQKLTLLLLFLIVTLFFSMLLYKYIELPVLNYRNKKYS